MPMTSAQIQDIVLDELHKVARRITADSRAYSDEGAKPEETWDGRGGESPKAVPSFYCECVCDYAGFGSFMRAVSKRGIWLEFNFQRFGKQPDTYSYSITAYERQRL